jgi:hypothetical protein
MNSVGCILYFFRSFAQQILLLLFYCFLLLMTTCHFCILSSQVSAHTVTAMETLVRTSSDVSKSSSPVEGQPSDLSAATLNRYFTRRRLLGQHGDAFSFEEVFGPRQWLPHSQCATAMMAEQTNKQLLAKVVSNLVHILRSIKLAAKLIFYYCMVF